MNMSRNLKNNKLSGLGLNMEKEISDLPPSQNLLNYYKSKMQIYCCESEDNIKLLDSYKKMVSPLLLVKEREQLLNDNLELREALSDANVFIHAERQQVSKLYLEKEILKTELTISEKKIHMLLQLTDISDHQLQAFILKSKKTEKITGILKTKFNKPIIDIGQDYPLIVDESEKNVYSESLKKKLGIYEEHFEAAKESWNEERAILLEDRNIKTLEVKAQFHENEARVKLLSVQLKEAQKLTYEATEKLIKLRSEEQRSQIQWMTERESLIKELNKLKNSHISHTCHNSLERVGSMTDMRLSPTNSCEVRHMKRQLYSLQKKLIEADGLKDMYERNCRKSEQNLFQVKEQKEADQVMYHEKLTKLCDVKELHKSQRNKLEGRLKLQCEGVNNERKIITKQIKNIVHQLYKLTRIFSHCNLEDQTVTYHMKEAISLVKSMIADIKKIGSKDAFSEES